MGGLIRGRRDTGTGCATADPILRKGEMLYDETRGILYVGDGVTRMSGLARTFTSIGPTPDWTADMSNALATYFPTITGNVAQDAGASFTPGGYGVMATPRVGTAAQVATSTVKWNQTRRYASIRARVRFDSVTPIGTSADCITLQNTNGVNHFDFFVSQTTGFLSWDLLSSDIGTTGYAPTLGKWYTVEAVVDFGSATYSAWVAVNGVTYPVVQSTLQVVSNPRSFHFGTGSAAKSYDMAGDDFAVYVSDTLPDWIQGGPITR